MKQLLYLSKEPIRLIVLVLSFLTVLNLSGQSPQAFKYQAVVRHSDGQPISSQNVSVRISILGETPTGTAVYVESHNILTSSGGLITFNIGGGNQQPGSGEFDEIAWGLNEFFVKVEVDPQGGTDYIDMGTSQLLSVPYALYAKESGTPSYKWEDLNGDYKRLLNPAPGSIVYVTDRHQMAYFDGNQWVLLVGCPDNTIAIAGDNQLDIIGITAQLNANVPGFDNTGNWSVIDGTGGIFSDIHDPAAIFTGVPGSAYTLKWTISTVCESNSDTIMISFCHTNTTAVAGNDQLNIIGTQVILEANEPGFENYGLWSVNAGIGGSFSDPTLPNSSFTGLPGHSYVLAWTISTDCDQENTGYVNISFCYELTIASAGTHQPNIDGSSVQLNASVPGVGNQGLWQIITGQGGSFDDNTNPATIFHGNAGEEYQLSWTITADCDQSSIDFTTVSFCPVMVQANAGNDVIDACIPILLQGNNPGPGNTGLWQIISGEDGEIVNPASPVTEFIGQPGLTYTLLYSISNACDTTQSFITISFEQSPTQANAGNDQLNINGTTANLNANTPEYGTGIWTIVSDNGGLIQNASNPTTVFNGQPGITYDLAWTISNFCGESTSDNVTIGFCPVLVAADAGEDTLLACDPYTLDANQPGFGNTGTWLIIAGAGGTISDIHDPKASFSGSPNVNYVLQWTISNACDTISAQVNITFEQPVTIADAGPDQPGIEGTSTNLDANFPMTGENGNWTILSGDGGNVEEPANPKSTFTGLEGQTYQLEWRITNTCYFSADIVTIEFIVGFQCGIEYLIDSRDGQEYPTVQIGNQCWMAKNLNVGIMVSYPPSHNQIIEKFCFGNDIANCNIYGGLYQWHEMMKYNNEPGGQGICPEGWFIPSADDFQTLINHLGGSTVAGGKLKEQGTIHWDEPNLGASNESLFTGLGAGYHSGSIFVQFKKATAFWSSSRTPSMCFFMSLSTNNATAGIGSLFSNYSFSVRCIKNNN